MYASICHSASTEQDPEVQTKVSIVQINPSRCQFLVSAPTSDDQSNLLGTHPSTGAMSRGQTVFAPDLRDSSELLLESLSRRFLTVRAGGMSKIDYLMA